MKPATPGCGPKSRWLRALKRLDSVMANHDAPASANDIRDLLVHLLTGVTDKPEAHWRKLVGEVTALPIVLHPRSNWRIDPTGKAADIEAIEKAAAVVREAHPYVPSPKAFG